MRHLPPRTAVLWATGFVELAAGVTLGFSWSQRHDPLRAVLAVVLLVCGAVTVGVARRPPAGLPGEDPGRDADEELVHLDRSSCTGEADEDRRLGVDASQVPTLGALVDWIEQSSYLPPTPSGHWTLRHRGQRAARIECPPGGFSARLLLPAEHEVVPGSHWSVAYERR